MLLLMTLAVLAISTCRAQEIHGNSPGFYFYINGEDQGELKGIRVYLSVIYDIKGIQLLFGTTWSDVYGTRSLKNEEFLLEDGEHVIQVDGGTGVCLTTLTFITDKGRSVSYGRRKGSPTFSDTGDENQYLATLHGFNSPGFCIKAMGFIWKNPPETWRALNFYKNEDDVSEEGKDSVKDKGRNDDDNIAKEEN